MPSTTAPCRLLLVLATTASVCLGCGGDSAVGTVRNDGSMDEPDAPSPTGPAADGPGSSRLPSAVGRDVRQSTLDAAADVPGAVADATIGGQDSAPVANVPDAGTPPMVAAPCPAQPIKIAELELDRPMRPRADSPLAMAVDDVYVYPSFNGIWRVRKDGVGMPQHFGPAGQTTDVYVDGGRLYWIGDHGGDGLAVFTASATGGPVERLFTDVVLPPAFVSVSARHLAIGPTHVFAMLIGAGQAAVVQAARADHRGQLLFTQSTDTMTTGLAADATHLYVSAKGRLWAQTIGMVGGGISLTARAKDLRLDANHLYWIEDAGALGIKLLRLPKAWVVDPLGAPVSPEIVTDLGKDAFESIWFDYALGPSQVYWGNDNGAVFKWSKAGGPATMLAKGGGFDDDDYDRSLMAADATSVYWISGPSGVRIDSDDPVMLLRVCAP